MCYCPIKILNPSRKFNNDMPVYISVPCGHCPDCLRNAHNEWYFRAYMEYLNCKSKNGAVYFLTLTYNQENLPSITFPDGRKQACFYKRHIHNFVKYVRIQLQKRGYNYKGIKYLICCEYGKNGTCRPHYHPLFFFPLRVPWFVLFNSDPKKGELGVFIKAWHYGFIVCSKMGFEIRSAAGIRYASKYVCKQLGFYKEGPIYDYLHGADCAGDVYKDRRALLADFLPRIYCSTHFGECFINDVINKQDDKALFLANNCYSLNNGDHSTFRIPRYYHLKLEKEINKTISECVDKVVLENTKIGEDVKHIIYAHKLLTEKTLLKKIDLSYLNETMPSNANLHFCVDYLKHTGYYNENCYVFERWELPNEEVSKKIVNYLKVLDLDKLSKYRAYLRDYPIYPEDCSDRMFEYVDDIIYNMVHPSSIPPEMIGTYYPFKPNLCLVSAPLKDVGRTSVICSEHPDFEVYEDCSVLLDYFYMCVSIVKECAYLQKKFEKEYTRYACTKNDCITIKCN